MKKTIALVLALAMAAACQRASQNTAAASSPVRRFFVCFILSAPFSLKKSRAAARLSFLSVY